MYTSSRQTAFSLLERASGPVLEDFPEVISSTGAEPLACSLPARFDPDVPLGSGDEVIQTFVSQVTR